MTSDVRPAGRQTTSLARTWHTGVAIIATGALLLQLLLVLLVPVPAVAGDSTGFRLLKLVSYFTIQSNLLVAVVATTLALDAARDGRLWRVVRLDALVAISVTGVVAWVALRPLQDLDGLDQLADTLLHVVSPLVVVIGWLAFGPRPRIGWDTIARSVVWPLAWFAFTLVMGELHGWYPYPFIDVADIGYARAFLNAGVVTVVFLALATGARLLDRVLPSAPGTVPERSR